jgi:hypothetical protein
MVTFLAFLFGALAMFEQSGNSAGSICERSKTNFGYVVVLKSDKQAAIREGIAAKKKAKSELNLSAPEFGIIDERCTKSEWGELDVDNMIVYPWVFHAAWSPEKSAPEINILRHEIGHSLFIRFLIPSTKAIQYGGDAPDWFDEMAAVSFEASNDRAIRRCELSLYARTSGLLPFKHFFSMTHPEHRGKTDPSREGELNSFAPSRKETLVFYAMVSGFDDYLRVRLKGRRVIPELVSVFKRGEPLGEFIMSELKLKNESGNFDELDADFKAWMVSDRRMRNAARCSY